MQERTRSQMLEDLVANLQNHAETGQIPKPYRRGSWRPIGHMRPSSPLLDSVRDLFEGQDHYTRQVRMPEPPFLLADRVTGIDAEPRSMGTGTIWTETDIESDSWYLHQGRMPGGLMIEAGQADLLLILLQINFAQFVLFHQFDQLSDTIEIEHAHACL